MKKLATLTLVTVGTLGFAGAAFTEGCNWGNKASMITAEANSTPVPAEVPAPVVAEADTPAEPTAETVIETAQAPTVE